MVIAPIGVKRKIVRQAMSVEKILTKEEIINFDFHNFHIFIKLIADNEEITSNPPLAFENIKQNSDEFQDVLLGCEILIIGTYHDKMLLYDEKGFLAKKVNGNDIFQIPYSLLKYFVCIEDKTIPKYISQFVVFNNSIPMCDEKHNHQMPKVKFEWFNIQKEEDLKLIDIDKKPSLITSNMVQGNIIAIKNGTYSLLLPNGNLTTLDITSMLNCLVIQNLGGFYVKGKK